MNRLPQGKQLQVLNMLVEGNSLRSITRMTRVHRTTVMNVMVDVGGKCRDFLDRWMCNLTLRHLELDEIWTFVLKKQARVPVQDAVNTLIGDQYLFVAIDQDTKLIPSYILGKRTRETTERFVQDLAARLVLARNFLDPNRPQLSTDGWMAYPRAIEDAFAGLCHHGVLIKDYRNAEMPGRYAAPEMVGATREVLHGGMAESDICTSHVERNNLNIRTFMRRFTRLALGFSKKFANLEAAISLYVAHYNFSRMHGSLPGTPAMAAKIAGHPWSLSELLERLED